MLTIQNIIQYLEQLAPIAYQSEYDNSGLLVGKDTEKVDKVLICLDITEDILKEAQQKHCQLVIAHHPLIFTPIKRLTGQNQVQRCIQQAIQHNIALYAIHTNLDHVWHGVNQGLAQLLTLTQCRILKPASNLLSQLVTFAPEQAVSPILNALHAVGAGVIGDYTHCSFVHQGTGRFCPEKTTKPYLGTKAQVNAIPEQRLEVVFPSHLTSKIVHVLQQVHPYEAVAYQLHALSNTHAHVGEGMIGQLHTPLSHQGFLALLKKCLNLNMIRHTVPLERPIQTVALCGGAGMGLYQQALQQQADAFITADIRYHDFFLPEKKLLLVDIGHYESEKHTKNLLQHWLSQQFPTLSCVWCETITNPVHYS